MKTASDSYSHNYFYSQGLENTFVLKSAGRGKSSINSRNKINLVFLANLGETWNYHLQLSTTCEKTSHYRGKGMESSKLPHTDCMICALGCLQLPGHRLSSNTFDEVNQCSVPSCTKPAMAGIWHHSAKGWASKSKKFSLCVTGISLGYTLAHT